MEQNINFQCGNILTFECDDRQYRILTANQSVIHTCQMNLTKLHFRDFDYLKTVTLILSGVAAINEQQKVVIDFVTMSEAERVAFNNRQDAMNELMAAYGPSFTILTSRQSKPELEKIRGKYGFKRAWFQRLYVRYIQSGFNPASLLDKRINTHLQDKHKEYKYKKKPGAKAEEPTESSAVVITPEIKQKFDKAIAYYKAGEGSKYISIEDAYTWMRNTQFIEHYKGNNGVPMVRVMPETKVPSYRQFYYYLNQQLKGGGKTEAKQGYLQYLNNERPLLGSESDDAMGPGDLVEVDAWESPVHLRSEVPDENGQYANIGKPDVYLMIDVYTKMILAISVALHNNSYIGLTNLFLNLMEDKKEFCKKFGINLPDGVWMSCIIPRRIRFDRGADMRSDMFEQFCAAIGVQRDMVTPGMGSMKASVERQFGSLHTVQGPELFGKGAVVKKHNAHPGKEAVLTLSAYIKMVVADVVFHNAHELKDYQYSADMQKANFVASPITLWQYGCEHFGSPRPIVNKDSYLWNMLVPVTVSISSVGIKVPKFDSMSYMNFGDPDLRIKMMEHKGRVLHEEWRYDPRDIGVLYYLKNGKLMTAGLNGQIPGNAGYIGMTYFDFQSYMKEQRRKNREAKRQNQKVRDAQKMVHTAIVAEAEQDVTQPNKTKNVRDARAKEKSMDTIQHSVLTHLNQDHLQSSDMEMIDAQSVPVQPIPAPVGIEMQEIKPPASDETTAAQDKTQIQNDTQQTVPVQAEKPDTIPSATTDVNRPLTPEERKKQALEAMRAFKKRHS